jgi:hypothetical protein
MRKVEFQKRHFQFRPTALDQPEFQKRHVQRVGRREDDSHVPDRDGQERRPDHGSGGRSEPHEWTEV